MIEGADNNRLARLATYASVGVATVLIVVKTVAWLSSDSVAMLSSLVDTLLDAVASVVNLLAVRQAQVPADDEHRFGHGKAEALAGLGQSAVIGGSAVFLILHAVEKFIHPEAISADPTAIGVSVFAIFCTFALVTFQRWVLRRTGSLVIAADSLHYASDLLLNAAVIVALLLAGNFGLGWADPLFALFIALYLLKGSYDIARVAWDHLMDRELPDETRRQIREIALRHPEARAVHDLRTRVAGNHAFIQLHLELDGELTLLQAHEIADTIERSLLEAFPAAEVIIHEDPAGIIEPRRPAFAAH